MLEKSIKLTENRQAFYNILSTAILSGISFFSVPVFTRMLGAEQYGLYSIFHSWVTIVTCFVMLECRSGLGTAKYAFGKNYKNYKSSTLLMGLIVGAVFLIIAYLFRNSLSALMGYPAYFCVFVVLTALSYHVVEFARGAFIYEKKAEKNLMLSVSLSVSTVILSIVLLKTGVFESKYLARSFGDIIPYFVVAFFIIISVFVKTPPSFNSDYWKYSLTLGIPIIFHGLSQDILKQSDRIMMKYMGYDGVEVGIYSFFCTFTAIVNVVLTALNTSWCPFYYDDLNEKAFDRIKKKCKNYQELFTVITCGFLLVSREVCYLFANEEYWSGMNVIPLLVVGIYFIFMYQFPVNYEFYNKKTTIIAVGTFSAAVLNILLNAVLIPSYGMYGAAFATAVSYGLLFAAHYIIVTHKKAFRFHMKLKDFIPGLAVVIVFAIVFYILGNLWVVRWIIASAIGIAELSRMLKRKSIF